MYIYMYIYIFKSVNPDDTMKQEGNLEKATLISFLEHICKDLYRSNSTCTEIDKKTRMHSSAPPYVTMG